MGHRQRILRAALVVCALMFASPAHALASSTQQSLLMDDSKFIYSDATHVLRYLQEAKALGVDRIKVSVVWSLVAPDPNSTRMPKFDATNPDAYPPGAWARWDQIITYARALGMDVYFQIVPPAPAWAVAPGKPAYGYSWSQRPNPTAFGRFVQAVATRYSGTFVPNSAADRPRDLRGLPNTLPNPFPTPSNPDPPIPRVDYWGVWNEPNEVAWLNPQFNVVHGRKVYVAPALYRRLVDSAYHAFQVTGHGGDTILIGETASKGWIYPLPFVQALYCVGSSDQPLTGAGATQIGCPSSGSRTQFASQHPGLFAFAAFAYHPYSFDVAPNRPEANPNWITLQDMWRLERTLDRIYAAYGRHPRGGVAMYLTEFGYKTNPPNPYVKTSLTQQATWINEGEYMAYQDPRVKALAQFLLVDSPPNTQWRAGTLAYWSTFQSGLRFVNGKLKPSYSAYRIPIWVPVPSHGRRVTIWGHLRPADHTTTQYGVIQFRPGGSRTWSQLRVAATNNSEGFLIAHVRIPSAGQVRLVWLSSPGQPYYSRTVSIS